jgi:hypothetical protein
MVLLNNFVLDAMEKLPVGLSNRAIHLIIPTVSSVLPAKDPLLGAFWKKMEDIYVVVVHRRVLQLVPLLQLQLDSTIKQELLTK